MVLKRQGRLLRSLGQTTSRALGLGIGRSSGQAERTSFGVDWRNPRTFGRRDRTGRPPTSWSVDGGARAGPSDIRQCATAASPTDHVFYHNYGTGRLLGSLW